MMWLVTLQVESFTIFFFLLIYNYIFFARRNDLKIVSSLSTNVVHTFKFDFNTFKEN